MVKVREFFCCNLGELVKCNTAADMVHPGCLLISTILNTRSMVCIVCGCPGILVIFVSSCPCSLVHSAFVPSFPFLVLLCPCSFWYLCSRVLAPSCILPSFHRFLFSYYYVLAPFGICVLVSLLPRAFLPSLPRFSFPRVLVPLNPRVLVVFVFQVNKSFPSLVFPLLFSEPRICFRRRKRVLL